MRVPSLEKSIFIVSLVAIAFLYGIATQAFGWFPSSLLEQAWEEAEVVASSTGLLGQRGSDDGWEEWLAPREYDRSGVRTAYPDSLEGGPILVTSAWKFSDGWSRGLKLIDRNGETLHHWTVDPTELFPDPPEHRTRRDPESTNLHGSYVFPDGDVLVNVSYVGVARLDACSRVEWTLPAGNHHSLTRADDGTFWITAGSWEEPENGVTDSTSFSGLPEKLYYDRLLHVREDGEILEEIDLLSIVYGNDLQRYIAKGSKQPLTSTPQDLLHLNDIEPLSASMADEYAGFDAGDLLLSIRNLDLLLVLDPATKRVKWHTSREIIQQHDPDFIGDGWVGVFDNSLDGTARGDLLGGSRIVAFHPATDSVKTIFPTGKSDPFYTNVMGKWQQLDNGNLLLTEAQTGRLVEVTPGGETVWDWVVEPYSSRWVPEVSEGSEYGVTREQVASWPCSPKASDTNRERASR